MYSIINSNKMKLINKRYKYLNWKTLCVSGQVPAAWAGAGTRGQVRANAGRRGEALACGQAGEQPACFQVSSHFNVALTLFD